MYVCEHMYMLWCISMWRLAVSPQALIPRCHPLLYFWVFETGSLTGLELPNWAGLVDQQYLPISVPQAWDYKSVLPHPDFNNRSGGQLDQVLMFV